DADLPIGVAAPAEGATREVEAATVGLPRRDARIGTIGGHQGGHAGRDDPAGTQAAVHVHAPAVRHAGERQAAVMEAPRADHAKGQVARGAGRLREGEDRTAALGTLADAELAVAIVAPTVSHAALRETAGMTAAGADVEIEHVAAAGEALSEPAA